MNGGAYMLGNTAVPQQRLAINSLTPQQQMMLRSNPALLQQLLAAQNVYQF